MKTKKTISDDAVKFNSEYKEVASEVRELKKAVKALLKQAQKMSKKAYALYRHGEYKCYDLNGKAIAGIKDIDGKMDALEWLSDLDINIGDFAYAFQEYSKASYAVKTR